jgi:hypothetical protein
VHSPFIVQGECLHCAGPRQVGPANRSLFYEIWRSLAPHCSLHSWEVDVRIDSLDMVLCHLAGTVPAVSVTYSGRRAVTVGLEPFVRRRSCADPPRRYLRAHCGSARLGAPVAGHHHPRARRRDGTVRRLCTVYSDTTRRLGNRWAYRDVSLPASCVSGRPYF